MTDNTESEQSEEKPWQFSAGQSGNPSGRPKGSRNRATLAVQALLEGEGEAITRKAIESAKEGDMTAIRLVLERLLPPRKDAPVSFELPPLKTAEDLPVAIAALIEAVSIGELTPIEAQSVANLLELHHRSLEACELEQRITALEGKQI
ncbi:MAG: DUF5681 domain-containing protein [Rickettsiales bacterium]|nr:DUF5681 domain-containing protein [Rickettsiales bacterium]